MAAEIEFAVIFVPTWAIYQADAAKKAAALPPWPYPIQDWIISSGFHISWPSKIKALAEVVTIPTTAHSVNIIGRNGSCMNCPLLDFAYREKSGMLHASVAQEPVTEDIEVRNKYALVLPETVAFCAKIFPDPPALWTHHPIVARAATGVAIIFTMNSHFRRVGGIKSRGSWMIQKIK